MGAYACHPYQGSEPTVGWNRAVESARFGDVHVLTHDEGNREVVERTVRERGLDHLHFHFVEHSALERRLLGLPGGTYPAYRRWQRRAYRTASEMHRTMPFDLAHQVNMVGYREPGDLWKLDIPFVWGPIGGTQNTPAAFLRYGGARMALLEGARSLANALQLRLSRRVRRAARAADVVLAANSTGQADLARVLGIEADRLLETGVRAVGEPRRWRDRAPGPMRVLWAGEVVQRKGIRVLLDAAAEIRRRGGPEIAWTVVGDGPDRALVEATADVELRGWVPRAELFDLYERVDALAFTSLRDTSGNVMLEALAAGLPVVYLDHQGAADVGSETCGIPVPVTTPRHAVRGVARGIATLATDPDLYDALSAGAIARAEQLRWTANGAAVNQIYADVLDVPALDPDTRLSPLRPRDHV